MPRSGVKTPPCSLRWSMQRLPSSRTTPVEEAPNSPQADQGNTPRQPAELAPAAPKSRLIAVPPTLALLPSCTQTQPTHRRQGQGRQLPIYCQEDSCLLLLVTYFICRRVSTLLHLPFVYRAAPLDRRTRPFEKRIRGSQGDYRSPCYKPLNATATRARWRCRARLGLRRQGTFPTCASARKRP